MDGLLHFSVSIILTTLLCLILPFYWAAFIVLLIGIGKEIYDKVNKKGCAEWKDLICDIVGILIGIL